MKIAVIGGSGHIGTFLIPRLVQAGHEVITISRGTREAYAGAPEWQHVRRVVADRQQEDREGTFGDRMAGLRADVVVDLVCFTLESATSLVDRLRGEVGHLLHYGSVWRYGPSRKLPISEDSGSAGPPFDEYGFEKDRIARMLKEETASGGLVTTSLHPGHIVGPGWLPIGPLGNFDPAVWYTLSAGERWKRCPGRTSAGPPRPSMPSQVGGTCSAATASRSTRPSPTWATRRGTSRNRPCSNPSSGRSNTTSCVLPAP
jgi:hypothetical protein